MGPRLLRVLAAFIAATCIHLPTPAAAQTDMMCDPSFQDCRRLLIDLINSEPLAIDVAMLFMEDDAMADAIIARHNAGVRVRILVEPRRNETTPKNEEILARLKAAGIPMRAKAGGGVLHWKFMIFDAQNILQFSAANYSDYYFAPIVPYANYTDEGIYFTGVGTLVDSFRRRFDDAWTDTAGFYHFGNIAAAPTRRYPLYGIDPELSFVPVENFATRSVPLYDAEQQRIDTVMYKITEPRHADGLIAAAQRGVPVRLITEPERYRNPANIWQAYHIDRLYMAGVQIRDRAHAGFLHQKSTLLYGQGLTIFGSSNWTNESNKSQYEHNYFTTKPWFFDWFRDNFDRKWTNRTGVVETVAFTPLPPDAPAYVLPANGATGVATSGAVLRWNPGPWSWIADVYFGTSPSPPLFKANVGVAVSETNTFALPALAPATTYYWRIVSKTMAQQGAEGPVYSFTTAGSAPPPPPPPPPPPSLPSPWQSQDIGNVGPAGHASAANGTFTVAGGGADVWGSADAFQFAWQRVSGDVDVIARVVSVENVQAWVKAGVMIRERLTPDSAHAFMLVSPAKGRPFQRRVANGGLSTNTASAGVAPAWVKLERRGNSIAAFVSENGATWVLVGSDTFAMLNDVYVGLAVSSHDATRLATATFDNVTVRSVATPPPPPPPPPNVAPSVSLTSPANGSTFTAPATISITASATDSDGTVARVDFFTGSTLLGSDTTAPYAYTWSGVVAGTYSLTARAIDDDGATTTSAAATVTVTSAPPPPPPPANLAEIVLHAANATTMAGSWRLEPDATAASRVRAWNPNAGSPKVVTAAANPVHFIELTFNAEAGRPYRLWIRGKAEGDLWSNDSAHVQFSGTVDAQGNPIYRIGTSSSAEYNLESCSGCGVAGWGWEDNGWGPGVLGPLVYFATTGPQRIRLQTREDGLSFDQIVLSSERFLTAAPGPNKQDTTILSKSQ